ncbi:hypothetical protein [Paenibacillus sp. TH7-28]
MAYVSNTTAIPKMTSNTTPSGVASASSVWMNGYEAWKAFDRINSSIYASGSGSFKLAYKFPEKKTIAKYTIVSTGSNNCSPKNWTFEGSNDNVNYDILHSVTNSPSFKFGDAEKREYNFDNSNQYMYYRLNVSSSYSGTVFIYELEMMEVIYEYRSLIFNENEYKTYKDNKFESIGTNLTEDLFLTYGLNDISTIPESAWAELHGDVELHHWTDDPNKTEVQFSIETEPFTLEDEFAGQTIKLIEYTDDPNKIESTITLETEPFTLYDEFSDSVDVLYYTDDPTKESAELVIDANYSPLDDLEGDFEIVTWTDNEEIEKLDIEMNALPFEQIFITPNDFEIFGTIQNVIADKVGDTGKLKMLMSFDQGRTWESCRYGVWNVIDIDDLDQVKNNAMTVHDIGKLKEKHFKNKGENIRLAYNLDESIHLNDPIKVDNIKIITSSPLEDVKFTSASFYLLNTLATINIKVAGNKLIGNLDDADKGKVQYRVFLNGKPYYPQDGAFTSLAPSPLNIQLNISERDIIFGVENALKVEFQDAWGQTDVWENKFVGTYSGLMFMDENKQYYSDTFGGILKYLDFDIIVAGQTTIDQKVIVKNQLGERVQNLLLEVQKENLPDGVEIQMSYTSSPFIPEDFILFNKFIEPDEENEFYVRIATQINAQPDPNGQFEIRAKVDPV